MTGRGVTGKGPKTLGAFDLGVIFVIMAPGRTGAD